ncbi:type IX secretion/gliding motility protein PorT/SprT [Robertkochia sediminum]|uniref:type IX secretion/gliding motility protein PorT/SprT n=1 Tax=Robertkochia sediminum TaxID=2785326 RepID=UPI0019322577|nr:porin family protein [Robertkochia sediminum]MBL7471718.1 PorT family protein [Robertkochia sediminum]
MTRTSLIAFFAIFVSVASYAQFNENPILNLENEDKKLVNWGYFLGMNQYGFKIDYKNDDGIYILDGKSNGFNVGLIGELRLNDHLDLRLEPGLFYTQRDLGFPNFPTDSPDFIRETKSTYIHIPLLLKASTKRLGNFKPYLVGGVSTSINLSSEERSKEDNTSGKFRMTTNTYYYEVGFGIDFYLYYFKFSPSIRGVFALTDELIPDNDPNSPWTGNIDGLYSRAIFINFTFE